MPLEIAIMPRQHTHLPPLDVQMLSEGDQQRHGTSIEDEVSNDRTFRELESIRRQHGTE